MKQKHVEPRVAFDFLEALGTSRTLVDCKTESKSTASETLGYVLIAYDAKIYVTRIIKCRIRSELKKKKPWNNLRFFGNLFYDFSRSNNASQNKSFIHQ